MLPAFLLRLPYLAGKTYILLCVYDFLKEQVHDRKYLTLDRNKLQVGRIWEASLSFYLLNIVF